MTNTFRKSLWLGACMTAALAATPALAKDFGLALTAIDYGPWKADDECPEGMATGGREALMKSVKPEERAEIEAYEKRVGGSAAYAVRTLVERSGPNATNLCETPMLGEDAPTPVGQGKVSEGFDLDGGNNGSSCAHTEYKTAGGKSGIDNQIRRLTACIRNVRDGRINEGRDNAILSGSAVTLVRVTGVDNNQNDPDVTVEFYKGRDSFVKDGGGKPLPDATMRADKNAKVFKAVTKGKIVDGVLITDPVDVRFMQNPSDYYIRDARIQIKLNADGTAEGMLGGYFDMESFWDDWARNSGQGAYTCPALYKSMTKLADGHKDAKTGQCTALSVSFNIKAIRTFVVPPIDTKPSS